MKKDILNYILKFYLKSKDYNGCPISDIYKKFSNAKEIKNSIIELIKDNSLELYYCETNPYVKNFNLKIPLEEKINLINELPDKYESKVIEQINIDGMKSIKIVDGGDEFRPITLYPSANQIKKAVKNKQKYFELPHFNKMLLEGMPHLHFLYFRVDVLNRFLHDPRYTVYNLDYSGYIHHYGPDSNANPIYLKRFGIAYNRKTNENAITILPHDLYKLSAKHQYHFYSHLLDNQKIMRRMFHTIEI